MGEVVRQQEEKYLGIHFTHLNHQKKKELKKYIKSLRRKGAAKEKVKR
jgi:hypothetical protein